MQLGGGTTEPRCLISKPETGSQMLTCQAGVGVQLARWCRQSKLQPSSHHAHPHTQAPHLFRRRRWVQLQVHQRRCRCCLAAHHPQAREARRQLPAAEGEQWALS
jgi:hypothetical protein